MIIHSYESTVRSETCVKHLERMSHHENIGRIILLPIPTTRDKITVLNTSVYINDVLSEINDDTVVCGYGLPCGFVELAKERGGRVLDLSLDEKFLSDNAHLTALCTVGILLTTTDRAPCDVNIGVVGYGRIGKRLTNMLLSFGAGVKVFTSRKRACLDLCECGVASSVSTWDADLSDLDVLINTAPAVIFVRERIPEGLRVIDLASGDNFPGIMVERYPSVPAKMFPKSAGRIWAEAVERFISDTQSGDTI